MPKLSITWLGHSTFILRSPGGTRVILDPWVATNPSCPAASRDVGELDLMLVTHGHEDHSSDVVPIAQRTGAQVVAPYELSLILQHKGVSNIVGMNPGGTLKFRDLSITMVPAVHSSSIEVDGRRVYAGVATGYVIAFEDGTVIYYAGDTGIFSDMKLIGDIYHPTIAFLPIGDLFTMGPDQAAHAVDLLNVSQVIPMHWGTFPQLSGTPARLRELVSSKVVDVVDLKPGQTI